MIDMRQRRWGETANTWANKTTALTRQNAASASEEERWLVGYDAGQFLRHLLDHADTLAAYVNAEDLEDLAHDARALSDKIRAERLAAKLENVTGRTAEEAEAFTAAAARLRGEDRK